MIIVNMYNLLGNSQEVFLVETGIGFYSDTKITPKSEYLVDPNQLAKDYLLRGVFDPAYVPFLSEAYSKNIVDPQWFRLRFSDYLQLVCTTTPAQMEEKRGGMSTYCNFDAEVVRMRQAKDNERKKSGDAYETVAQVLQVADVNLQTLVNELLLGASTRYGYKLVQNPYTRETKVVFYDTLSNGEETWEEAWKREDVRISFLRSIDHSEKHLQLREWVNLYVFNNLCERWQEHLYENSLDGKMYGWFSPPPSQSGYGYGTISMLFWYGAYKSGNHEVTIGARTLITEYSTAHLRALVQDIVHPDTADGGRAKSLADIPSDIDLLSFAFNVRDEWLDFDLSHFAALVEKQLDLYNFIHDRFPEHVDRQKRHVSSRVIEDSVVDETHRRLLPERQKWLSALKNGASPKELRRLMDEGYDLQAQKVVRDLRKEMWFAEMNKKGVKVTAEMEAVKLAEFIAEIQQRKENGSCPAALRKKKIVRVTKDGEIEEEEVEDNTECMIKCTNMWIDDLGSIVSCTWREEASENPIHTHCPWCGWNPEMPKTIFLQQGKLNIKKQDELLYLGLLNPKDVVQVDTYAETTTDNLIDDLRDFEELDYAPYEIDDNTREIVYFHFGLIPERRQLAA